jgi:hypothetical protein
MRNSKLVILLTIVMSAAIIISACSPTRIRVEDYDGPLPEVTISEPEAAEVVTPEPVEEEEAAPVEEEENTLEDIPIMEDAYDIQRGSGGRNVIYTVDGDIEEVVGFYQAELPNYGWEMAGPPDNAVSNIATMLRENSDGDRLAINMQYNALGGFVRATITISRAD